MTVSGRPAFLAALVRAIRGSACALVLTFAGGAAAIAQSSPGVYAPGDAAVTGFSGAIRPFQIEPGQDPNLRTFVDPDGPSLRVIDLRRMDGPPSAQPVGTPKPFTVSAKMIGQVFGVAVDDKFNIYVAASSAYGIAIVAPGPDGQLQRIRQGSRDATFMAAQWGPSGGPGSIWKINGATGAVTLFANVATGGKPNRAAALGGLAFDPISASLFVADRETGLIHRFGASGSDLGAYDHGIVGAAAAGLPSAPPPPAAGADISSPQFDSARPETWGYAAPARRVFGLAVHGRRLYYAIAEGLQVYSVGLRDDGSFGTDARLEVAVPTADGRSEISRIAFDDAGRIYLAERPAPTGAQDFEALSVPSIGRVLRYAVIGTIQGGKPIWQPLPDEYAIGLAADFRNGNGGVAIGYSYDADGKLNPASCGGFVWSTGEQLRRAADAGLIARLGRADALAINGLQGNPVWRVRRGEQPPLLSYFIDYADAPFDSSARGHLGDIAILRLCTRPAAELRMAPAPAGAPPFVGSPIPPGLQICKTHVCGPDGSVCPPSQIWIVKTNQCGTGCPPPDIVVNGQCCSPIDLEPGGACSSRTPSTDIGKPMCGAAQTAIGADKQCCDNSQIYSGPNGEQQCCAGALVNGKCDPLKPKIPDWACPGCCAPGYTKTGGKCCLTSQMTSTGQCCASGQTPSADGALCVPRFWLPRLSLCCAPGFVPTGKAKCCAAANLTTSGECCAVAVDPQDRKQCPTQTSPPQPCKRGEVRNSKGACVSATLQPTPAPREMLRPKCRPNERRDARGGCVARKSRPMPDTPPAVIRRPTVCPPGFVLGPLGQRCLPARGGRIIRPPVLGGGRDGHLRGGPPDGRR